LSSTGTPDKRRDSALNLDIIVPSTSLSIHYSLHPIINCYAFGTVESTLKYQEYKTRNSNRFAKVTYIDFDAINNREYSHAFVDMPVQIPSF
jgi:hypothetical protein